MTHQVATAAISACVILVLAWFGLTSYLGAHPVAWPLQVALFGAPIGALISVVAGLIVPSKLLRGILFVTLLLAAWGLAHYGKTRFAASYAEDQLAGQIWYFGWIATCAMATAGLATTVSRER